MERLTELYNGIYVIEKDKTFKEHRSDYLNLIKHTGKAHFYISGKFVDKLAQYEDTALTPEEIVEMREDATELLNENKELKKQLSYKERKMEKLNEKIAEDLSVQAVVEMPTYEDFAEGRVYSYTFENIGGVEYEMFINEQSWLVIVAENGAEIFRADFTEDGYKRAVDYIDSRELCK